MRIEGDFERDGAVCDRGAVPTDHIDLARAAIEATLAELPDIDGRPDHPLFHVLWRRQHVSASGR